MNLTFEKSTHTYRLDGACIPGVTSILDPLHRFDHVPKDVLDAARDFGVAVHRACELHDLGTLDCDTLDPSLKPYLDGWIKFSADYAVQWEAIEQPVFHPKLRYAGTPDRFGKVAGEEAVVDIKTPVQLHPSFGPQLAAYAQALGKPFAYRLAVQLKDDGNYLVKPYKDANDWPVFASILTLRNWCKLNNVQPNFKGMM